MKSHDKIAFLFPGQGQLPSGLPPTSVIADYLLRLAESNGLPLQKLLQTEDHTPLSRTEYAQPVILIDSLAKAEALRAKGITPDIVAGHSLGEYAALVTAEAIAPKEALKVIIERGRLMSEVNGAMAAVVKFPAEETVKICESFAPNVVVANYNGPAQTVISGAKSAVNRAMKTFEDAGANVIPLAVTGPFHSPFMNKAQAALASAIEALVFRRPSIPIISSVSGQQEEEPAMLKRLLLTQITSSVRWLSVVQSLVEEKVTVAVEAGPGKVLTGLGKRITSKIDFLSFEEAENG